MPQWRDPKKIVSIDPWGHLVSDVFRKQLNKIAPVYPDVPGLFDDPKEWE